MLLVYLSAESSEMGKKASEIICWSSFLLLLLLFIRAKYPDLSLPYFWDEAGVYVPGALRMKDTAISLLPDGLEPLYSRGHPLLCYATFAAGFRLFGDSVWVGHAVALGIACLTLLVFFLFVKEVFGRAAALMASLLLCVQPMFYSMSGFILPEMMLTLFSVLGIWGLSTQRWWLYLLGACLAVLTKESGLILPAVAFIVWLQGAVKERRLFSANQLWLFLAVITPVLLFAGFIGLQKMQHGWYFFPLHTQLMQHSIARVIHKCLVVMSMLFHEQGRGWLALLTLLMLLINAIYPGKDRRITAALHWSLLFLLLSIAFSATNYYLHRYILPVIPFMVLPGVWFSISITGRLPRLPRYAVLLGFTGFCVYEGIRHQDSGHFADTNDMSYKQLVLCQKDCIRWVAQQPWSRSLIMVNFPVNTALVDQRMGYLSPGTRLNYTVDVSAPATYGIFYRQDGAIPPLMKGYRIIRQFQRRDAVFAVVQFL